LVVTDHRKLFDLSGKTAVVLGAASGIGRSSAAKPVRRKLSG
jgi:NAD(P)-dependent dehydrogenase (short-subunit alcohol dehydrogenase family)